MKGEQPVARTEALDAQPGEPRVTPIPSVPVGILALDIDGTLLGPDGKLGERTRRAVHAAGEAGWLVTLATGRRWGSTKPVADSLGLEAPLIVFNGAVVRDSITGETLVYNPLGATVVRPLLRALLDDGLQPVVYEDFPGGERILTGPEERDNAAVARWLDSISSAYAPLIQRLPVQELLELDDAVRILIAGDRDQMRDIPVLASRLGLDYRTLVYAEERGGYQVAELLHPAGTKAAALEQLARRYGLTIDDVIAVGDGHNDLEMLAEAAIGVAMGQAPAEVRAHATLTIGGHADEGLAAFIEEYLVSGRGFPRELVRERGPR